ncbi:MAG: hypothetical protein J6J75_08440, partial [Alistipes sp.]|nr:hypothetical protein [Alistipes sp.]
FGGAVSAQTAQTGECVSVAETEGKNFIKTPEGKIVVIDDSDLMMPDRSVFELFMDGDWVVMSLITLMLVAIFFAAWKAPAWVKELGLLALTIGLGYFMIGVYGVSDFIANTALHVNQHILCSGLRVAMIAPTYGLFVYGVSLIVRIVQKPRLGL